MSEVGAVGTCVSRDVVKVVRSVLGPGSVMGGATHDRHMVPVITAFEANSWQCHMSGRGGRSSTPMYVPTRRVASLLVPIPSCARAQYRVLSGGVHRNHGRLMDEREFFSSHL